MKIFSRILALLPAALLLLGAAASCKQQDPEALVVTPQIAFKTNPVGIKGGSQFITVTANSAWKITVTFKGEQKDWMTIAPLEGEGDYGNVALSWNTNDTEFTRKAEIVIASGSKSSKYTFTQNGPSPDSPVDGGESEDPAGEGGAPTWLELPDVNVANGYVLGTHYMKISNVEKRNYTFCWSKKDMVSIWVAYPMNSTLIGKGSRPNPEPWAKDPLLEDAGISQPDVTHTFSKYTRGHQIASADRYVGNGNAQTYYSSNMTPQEYNFNGGLWASLEGRVRTWAQTAGTDTCYVVSGCVVDDSTEKSYSGSIAISVPTAYFKAVLRHTGVPTVGYNGYSGYAIWLEHFKNYGEKNDMSENERNALYAKTISDYSISIDKLETLLGYDLFAALPDKVGKETADKIEAEDPHKSSWNWNL